jgi:hypothetical protein
MGKSWLLQCNQCVSQCGILGEWKETRVFVHYTTRIPRVTSRLIQWMSWWVREDYVVLSRYDTNAESLSSHHYTNLWNYGITERAAPVRFCTATPWAGRQWPSETWAPVGRFHCRICTPCRFCKVCTFSTPEWGSNHGSTPYNLTYPLYIGYKDTIDGEFESKRIHMYW